MTIPIFKADSGQGRRPDRKHPRHYGLPPRRRAADHPIDGALTGVAWFIATMLVIFYGLGMAE